MTEQAEELGVMVIPETSADRLLVEDGVVAGVRTGDKGRGKEGRGARQLRARRRAARAGHGALRGHPGAPGHGAAIEHFDLEADPQVWALGVKEVWKVAKPLDKIIHTLGWPLRKGAKYQEFGGSFIYPMGDDHICIGFVTGLDSRDAEFSVHDVLQEFKTHPFVKKILEGGERVAWGAKTIPEGGWWSLPTQLAVPGAVIAGDSAGMVNVPKLKGVHLAMRARHARRDAGYHPPQGGQASRART